MSINVTVTGNPISIQKGSMVTASPNHSKKEFERRRLIRLSQVRQQSKNIAEEVRNRVRRQKLKQVEEIEKEGQKKLKQWQAKKLLELQNQYHEALRDIGAGHKGASLLEDEADVLKEKKENDSKAAKQRASVAIKKLHDEKEKLKYKVTVPIQKKKLVREIENKRSQMVTSLKRSSESLRKKSIEKVSTETEVSGVVTESDQDYEDIEELEDPKNTNIHIDIEKPVEVSEGSSDNDSILQEILQSDIGKVSGAGIASSDADEKLLKELTDQRDTRISDRIKRRNLHRYENMEFRHDSPTSHGVPTKVNKSRRKEDNTSKTTNKRSDTSVTDAATRNVLPKIQQNIYSCSCKQSPIISCHCTKSSPKMDRPSTSDVNKVRYRSFTDDETKQPKVSKPQAVIRDIPVKPKVTLKSVKSPGASTFSTETVHQLQSQTRSAKAICTNVEKITENSLRISPDIRPEIDFYERMIQRDKEALLRGQKALEREKLQRDYNELMRKLPALQKMERLNKMNQDKPEYHMNEERLLEQERKKQSILDNTYEKLFPDRRPPKITIPIKNTSKSSVKEKEAKSDDSTLNLGTWEADRRGKKLYTEEEVEAMLREGKFPSESKFKTDQLKSVLEKLRKQKEELLREIQNLPDEMDTLSKVLPVPQTSSKNDDNLGSSHKAPSKKTSGKKMVSVKIGTSSKAKSSSSESIQEVVKTQEKPAKQVSVSSKSVQVSPPAPPRPLSPRKKQDVQNMGEQSTKNQPAKDTVKPSPINHQKQVEPVELVAPSNSAASISEKLGDEFVSCECKKDTSQLCEIVIKIKDGKSSEVVIKEKSEKGKKGIKVEDAQVVRKQKDEVKRREREIQSSLGDDCCRVKPESWHEKLSRNTSQVSNSSTSYMSPPTLPNKPEAPPYYCSIIGKKPQQSNLNGYPASPPTKLPVEKPTVLEEIQRLLNMSRMSIDELGVSSVSSVSTPSQSVINLESNKPTNSVINDSNENSFPNFSFLTVSSENRTLITTETDGNSEQYPDILAKYAKIADQCSQRISSLSAMIQKVREEKNRMLQTPSLVITNDSSTRYMDLPSPDKKSMIEKSSFEETKSSSSSSLGDVLDINYDLAEKLRSVKSDGMSEFQTNDTKMEQDLHQRLKALKEPPVVRVESIPEKSPSEDFVPLLLDIPKMPPLTSEVTKRRKPPPSKGFLAAKKFTEDSGAPHELSTIPEQDSQTRFESTLKATSPQTPKGDKKMSVQETIPEPKKSPPLENKKISSPSNLNESLETPLIIKTKPLKSGENQKANVRDLLNFSDNSFASSNTSGDEKIEMFRIEAMLKSIGMDWAISTLRKTQETLALTSSSSSIDLKTSTTIKEVSENEMKEYLTKHLIQKISSSTLKSDASPGSLNETHELSDIKNADFSKKQTSTPVNRSREMKNLDRSSDLPSAIEPEKDSKDFFSLTENSM